MKRRLFWALLCVFFVVGIGACRTSAIYNVYDSPYSPSASATDADMVRAIRSAGTALGWGIEKVGPGELKGTLQLRHHVAVVAITYDRKSFSIEYLSSEKLMHHGNQIHTNYNRWIKNLEKRIRNEVSQI